MPENETPQRELKLELNTPLPHRGWVRAIRDALGMSARQLGQRIGITQQRTAEIEQKELQGAITINSLRQVAEAMDCVFVS